MLRRKFNPSYKHMLMPNSDTESDDGVVEVRVKKNNGKGIILVDKENIERNKGKGKMVNKNIEKKKGKRKMVDEHVHKKKKLISAEKALKSKARVDHHRGPDLVEVAEEYQRHMKKTPIPRPRGRVSTGVALNWLGTAKALKSFYGQPLHYLTFKLCKEWDHSRFGSEDEDKPLDSKIQWSSVESTIWKVEEVHRLCTSPYYLAMLWENDTEYIAFLDQVIP